MKNIFVLIALSAICIAVIGVFHTHSLPLYEWTRIIIVVPIILAGLHYRRAGATSMAILLYIAQSPFYCMQFFRDLNWGVNYCVANMAVCGFGIFLVHVIRIEKENAGTLNQVQETLDKMESNTSDEAMIARLEEMVRERGDSDIVETYLFDDNRRLVRMGGSGSEPLPDNHFFHSVAASGQPFVSRFTAVDTRLRADAPNGAAAPSQIAVFPLAWGERVRGVTALAESRNENFGSETVAFITTLIQSVENQLELLEKRRTTIAHEIQRLRIRNTFSSYVSRSVADEILKDPDRVDPGGKLTEATVLFTEIINFEELQERVDPVELIGMLNEYFSAAIDSVFAHEGTLDKFIGDSVMAFWGAPLPMENAADCAVQCARDLHARVRDLNIEWERREKPVFHICVGINTGSVVAGNIGSVRRMEYTVIGDTVNVAARIKSMAGKNNIPVLISDSTRNALHENYSFPDTMHAALKGKAGPINVHRLAVD